jgi:hypothetical protein
MEIFVYVIQISGSSVSRSKTTLSAVIKLRAPFCNSLPWGFQTGTIPCYYYERPNISQSITLL